MNFPVRPKNKTKQKQKQQQQQQQQKIKQQQQQQQQNSLSQKIARITLKFAFHPIIIIILGFYSLAHLIFKNIFRTRPKIKVGQKYNNNDKKNEKKNRILN